MGILNWLFGRKPADAKTSVDRRKWHRSQAGNLTRQVEETEWVTVYQQDEGWKFAAPYPKEVRDKSGKPYFSPPFVTEQAAAECADAYMADRRWPHEDLWTKRQREKPAMQRAIIPDLISNQQKKIDELLSALDRHESRKTRKPETAKSLRKKITLRLGILEKLSDDAQGISRPDLVAEAEQMASRLRSAIERLDALDSSDI